jgi:hypothetical protein
MVKVSLDRAYNLNVEAKRFESQSLQNQQNLQVRQDKDFVEAVEHLAED